MYGTILMLLFSNILFATYMYSIVPAVNHMVMDFGLADTRSTTGYYASLILGVQFFGELLSAIPAGKIADRCGRKPVILASLICIVVTAIFMGLALDYWSVIIARFLFGTFCPLMTTAKV